MSELDALKFGATAFAAFGFLAPFGGPYTASDWIKGLKASDASVSTFTLYAVQILWMLERLTAGLGIWFFTLSDWSHYNFAVAIYALFFFYALLDFYCWPGLYFYPVSNRNYFFVAGAYFLGWVALVVSWILAIVQRAFTTAGFFWTYFALSVLSTVLAAVLAGLLIYVHRSGNGNGNYGGAPVFSRNRNRG